MKVSDWIADELLRLGVQRIYMLPGGFALHLNDSISHSNLQVVYFLDEKAAGFAACAEAQYTGKLAVVVVTAGPGSTNLMTSVANAWCDSLPILIISGEINTPEIEIKQKFNLREGSAQDVDMLKVARPIVKYIDLAINPDGVKFIFNQAVKYALEGRRGPAWCIIPLDVSGMPMEEK